MSKTNKIWIAVLALQTGLAVLLWILHSKQSYDESSARSVVELKKDEVTALEIAAKANKDGDPPDLVKLAKKEGKWVMASADDYPADAEKVTKVIDKLLEMKIRDAISANPANHDTLRVGDKDYGRKVSIESGTKKVSFVVGSGSGSSANVRFDKEKEVYKAPGASVWSISSGARSFIGEKLVDIDKDKVTQLVVTNEKGTLSFKKEGDAWKLAELPAGKTLDDDKVKSLVEKACSLSLSDVVGKTIKPEYGLGNGAKVAVTATIDGAPKTTMYEIGAKKDDNNFYGKIEGNDYVVILSKWSTDQQREKSASDFVKEPPKEENKAAGEGAALGQGEGEPGADKAEPAAKPKSEKGAKKPAKK